MTVVTVAMDDIIIRSITLCDITYPKGYTEAYSENEHEQVEAFEMLSACSEEEHIITSLSNPTGEAEEQELPGLVGPKRIEVTLRAHNGAPDIRLVVTDIMPPAKHYSVYTVTGRIWRGKALEKAISTRWASSMWLARIDTYLGGTDGSATEHFTLKDQKQAWAALEKSFYKLKPAELRIIQNWDVKNDSSEEWTGYGSEWFGPTHRSQHWTSRAPYNYTPAKAHFRVAGDEVGAVLYQKQLQSWEEEGKIPPDKSLKELLETKAEKESDAESTSDKSSSEKDTQVIDDNSGCPDCGKTSCPPHMCEQDFGIGTGGGITLDGSYTIH